MSEQEAVWYYSQHGERKGPVTLEVLKGAITHMKVDREKDLVWGPGLPNWVKVAEVPELQGISSSPPPVEAAKEEVDPVSQPPAPPVEKKVETSTVTKTVAAANPYQAPASAVDDEDNALAEAMEARHRGDSADGMGRLMYFFAPAIMAFLGQFVGVVVGGTVAADDPELNFMIQGGFGIVVLIMILLCTFSRLKNLGMSRWSVLWSIVPVMNIWLGYRLYACPAGYQTHKKLDGAGKVMTGVYVIMLLLNIAVFASVLFIGADYYKKAADEAQRKLDMQQSEKNEVLGL